MLRFRRIAVLSLALAVILNGASARAENEGQDDLDKATEAKLTATQVADLNEVIELCESAIEKGLSDANKAFAEQLLASTLIQRGMVRAKAVSPEMMGNPAFSATRKAAIEDIEKGLKLSPDQPEALFQIARMSILPGGDQDKAVASLDRAIELSADDPRLKSRALVLRSTLHTDPEKRLKALSEAIEIAPDMAAAFRARAMLYVGQKKFDEALADLDKAIATEPGNSATYEVKALILGELKKFDEAIDALNEMQKIMPGSIQPLVQKARVYSAQNKLREALKELDEAHLMEPKNLGVLLLRATVSQGLDMRDNAMKDVERALEIRPDLQPAMRMRALLLADGGEMDKAVVQLEELRKLAPKDLVIMMQLAAVYQIQKEYQKSADTYSEVLAESPEQWMALRGRGDALLALGKHKEAIADYEAALKLKTDEAVILNNLAWVLATSPFDDLRDGKRAVELAEKACELTEYKAEYILSTLAAAYAEQGDFKKAVKWVKKAIKLGGKDQPSSLKEELEFYKQEKPWRELEGQDEK